MYLLVNELPKEKFEDANNILALLEFQLKMRDIDHITGFVEELSLRVNSSHIYSASKKVVYEKLKGLREEGRYTFTLPGYYKEVDQQVLGSKANKKNIDNLKH